VIARHRREAPLVAALAAFALASAIAPGAARAAGPLAPQGQPITTSDYTIDFYEGPVFAGSRVVGLAGSNVAIADGVSAYPANPAAAAYRVPWSVDWFDWEIDGSVTLPSSVTNIDFDNNGDDSFANSANLFLSGGAAAQFGALGLGVQADVQRYVITARDSRERLDVDVTRVLLAGAYSVARGYLILGLGVSSNSIDLAPSAPGASSVATVNGVALHAGMLLAPPPWPARFGASVRVSPKAPDATPALVEPDEDGDFVSGGLYLPRTVTLPTEAQVGVAVQLFRPINVPWVNPRDVKRHAWSVGVRVDGDRRARQRERANAMAVGRRLGHDEATVQRVDAEFEADDRARRAAEDREIARAHDLDRVERRRAYQMLPREKVLLTAAVKVTSATNAGVGLESFLSQKVERSGEAVNVSPRFGAESEVVPHLLVARGGAYYEPTRFRTATGRAHGTAGFDLRLPFESSVFGLFPDDTSFRVGASGDLAERYFAYGVSFGIWR